MPAGGGVTTTQEDILQTIRVLGDPLVPVDILCTILAGGVTEDITSTITVVEPSLTSDVLCTISVGASGGSGELFDTLCTIFAATGSGTSDITSTLKVMELEASHDVSSTISVNRSYYSDIANRLYVNPYYNTDITCMIRVKEPAGTGL